MKLSVACAQLECKSLDTEANLRAAESSIREAASRGAQLVLLPEYATTGLVFDRRIVDHAETIDGDVIRQVTGWSTQYGCWIGAGIVECTGKWYHNTLVLISPVGQVWTYRKRYLAFFEHLSFKRGRETGIVATELGRIGLMICWDMIHTRLVRQMQGQVDLLLIASAWPDLTTGSIPLPGIQSWLSRPPRVQPPQLARQLGVPVVYCNMGGRFTTRVPGLPLVYESAMAGHSAIVDADGVAARLADSSDNCLLVGDVNVPQFERRRAAA